MAVNQQPKLSRDRPFLVELFVVSNLAFLILDIYVAHSVNAFHHWAEWIPFYYAIAGVVILLSTLIWSTRFREGTAHFDKGLGRRLGFIVAWSAIFVGIGGLVLHLESQFFQALTLRTLVYSAPFVAPLSFAGLGFLLLLNRMVPRGSMEWGKWVIFLALGGFLGTFMLSLADHAQNGFFYLTEWIPVVVSAVAVGYLLTIIVGPVRVSFLNLGFAILALQMLTGLLGFYFHIAPVWEGSAALLSDNIIYGAPVFAPLLFADLAVLAAIGLWDVRTKMLVHGTGNMPEMSSSYLPTGSAELGSLDH